MAATTSPPPTHSVPTAFATVGDLLGHLGGVAPDRVRLTPPPGTATEADLIARNQAKLGLCELFDGTLVEKTVGLEESLLAVAIATFLRSFVVTRNLGIVLGADGMIRLTPGNIRVPDVAYLSWARTPGRRVPSTAYSDLAPDLAVEVLNPSNTRAEMTRKRAEYFAAGVRLIWEVDPRARTVTVHAAPNVATVLAATMILDGGAVLPGFALPLADLFAELDRHE